MEFFKGCTGAEAKIDGYPVVQVAGICLFCIRPHSVYIKHKVYFDIKYGQNKEEFQLLPEETREFLHSGRCASCLATEKQKSKSRSGVKAGHINEPPAPFPHEADQLKKGKKLPEAEKKVKKIQSLLAKKLPEVEKKVKKIQSQLAQLQANNDKMLEMLTRLRDEIGLSNQVTMQFEPMGKHSHIFEPPTTEVNKIQKGNNVKRVKDIQTFCIARGIHNVVHFTRLENMSGILQDGIIPRSNLESKGVHFVFNDDLRIDGHKNAVCLSISFPNYRMFYPHRQANKTTTWIVLLIRAEVLWELDCAFCWTNAASNDIRHLDVTMLKDSCYLEKMFADQCESTKIKRADCAIPICYPTNPQAEVLAFSGIPISYVTAGYINDQASLDRFLSTQSPPFTIKVEQKYFSPRDDWEVWKQSTETNKGELWQDDPFSNLF